MERDRQRRLGLDPLERALELPNGATFHRCALQVNPHDYSENFRGAQKVADAREYSRQVVQKAEELDISVLAITDHNSVRSVAGFREAATGRGVVIFPGFELCSSDGVHVLCLYPPETGEEVLERYLGEFGIRKTEPSTDLAKKTVLEILDKVPEQGGITIAAHATNKGGLLHVLKGQPRVLAWQSPSLQAIQIPARIEDLPQEIRPIVENVNPEYRRDNPVDDRLAVAVVNAKDVTKPEDLEDPGATCLIKMSEIGIEGFRQAFLDPGSRIRLNPLQAESEEEVHSELVAIAWEGGFFDGAALHFNPNLNVLIGGRGTGKSTVIESIRAVLGLEPIGEEARKGHEGIKRNVLGSAAKLSLLVEICRPEPRKYRIERTLPNPAIVRDESGAVSNLHPLDVLPGIEVYGQHEISELSKSPEKRTRLLERFVDRDPVVTDREAALARSLEKNRKSLLEAQAEVQEIEERIEALPGLEETLERFREAGLEARLGEKSLLVREERILDTIPERLTPFEECRDALSRELPIDRVFLSSRALEGLPGREILAKLDGVFQRLEERLSDVLQQLEGALVVADEEIEAVREDWKERKEEVERKYEKILRDLHRSRVDGEEFIRLRRQIEELRPLRERSRQGKALVGELERQRRDLLIEWEEQKAASSRALDRAAKSVSQKLKGRVEVRVVPAGNREPLAELLRVEIGGQLKKAIDQFSKRQELSLPDLVETCRQGAERLIERYHLTPAAAERLAGAGPETLMRLEELHLGSNTEIRLNTAPAGEPPTWQELEDLSTGQKATAVLLLLLLDSDAPLVVDQPEDDLDNRFITEGVVPRMREEKQRRQFLFSTHNANIPVLGDAELIVGLTASGDEAGGLSRVCRGLMGSIDSRPVQELIEEVLEGGKEAFEQRRRKYGF